MGGKALVYVWALEQCKQGRNSTYLKQNKKNRTPASALHEDNSRPSALDNICVDVIPSSTNINHDEINNELFGVFEDTDENDLNKLSLNDSVSEEKCKATLPPREEALSALPVHKNRTNFLQQDMLVPWKIKPQNKKTGSNATVPVYHRFYHTFKQGELETLCSRVNGLEIDKSYYDEGNWCIIFRKF